MPIVAPLVAAVLLVAGGSRLRRVLADRRAREARLFEEAAAQAVRLAANARIVDARITELCELVIEQSLAEIEATDPEMPWDMGDAGFGPV